MLSALNTKSFGSSEEHYVVFFGDVVETYAQKLLGFFYGCCCCHVKFVVFELDQMRVLYGVLDAFVA
jgi:hypothetical protein